ncbi:MAG: hypothetical protein EP343_28795 [Deltaproteobacteria bacterium]|nr:MAG: hypothetical protein EP343_28795 [Deltaproteobacteria bacterium]
MYGMRWFLLCILLVSSLAWSGCCPAIDCGAPFYLYVTNATNKEAVDSVTVNGATSSSIKCDKQGSSTYCSAVDVSGQDLTITVSAPGFKDQKIELKYQKASGICGGCPGYKAYATDGKERTGNAISLQPE